MAERRPELPDWLRCHRCCPRMRLWLKARASVAHMAARLPFTEENTLADPGRCTLMSCGACNMSRKRLLPPLNVHSHRVPCPQTAPTLDPADALAHRL